MLEILIVIAKLQNCYKAFTTGQLAQQGKVIAAKSEVLSLTPGTHMSGGTDSPQQSNESIASGLQKLGFRMARELTPGCPEPGLCSE